MTSLAFEEDERRRSPEDKRRAVLKLLNDPEWSRWSDREIARQCRVSHTFVAEVRASRVTGNRVPSSRRLERECQRNIELIWLTGQLAPDFKTIADFRKDNGAAAWGPVRRYSSKFQRLN